jgi:hypothetical protein
VFLYRTEPWEIRALEYQAEDKQPLSIKPFFLEMANRLVSREEFSSSNTLAPAM